MGNEPAKSLYPVEWIARNGPRTRKNRKAIATRSLGRCCLNFISQSIEQLRRWHPDDEVFRLVPDSNVGKRRPCVRRSQIPAPVSSVLQKFQQFGIANNAFRRTRPAGGVVTTT